ncbi:MAG: sulfur carrier protein ThiS, partial [Clostridium sp.]|nr:sulfur carrier protein ThiS [Clostridium sp.]
EGGSLMTLNNRPYSKWREGLTVQDVIDENRFTWPKLVVKLNKTVIWPEEYAGTVIAEDDILEVIHLLGGG